MNEQLKFSWGHIIAFLALIMLSYITFVGVTYMTNGNFAEASIAMVSIDVVLLLFFIGAQMAKATECKFKRWIVVERILIFCSPIAFCLCMIPFSHFWTVHSKNEKIVSEFTKAIEASKQVFLDYDNYSKTRIKNYEGMLNDVIVNKSNNSSTFSKCGFAEGKESLQKQNMIHTLQLQLMSDNYNTLKQEANKWIEQSSNGASIWNVFLLGNIKEIKSAIHGWNEELAKYAAYKMSNEEKGINKVMVFDKTNASIVAADSGLDNLKEMFISCEIPNAKALLFAIVLYFALLFPYILQDRHTKSQYRLKGLEKGSSKNSNFIVELNQYIKHPEDAMDVPIQNSVDSDDDFASFTM